ncbi:acyltransferase family protein [Streptomyces sp. LZ34]
MVHPEPAGLQRPVSGVPTGGPAAAAAYGPRRRAPGGRPGAGARRARAADRGARGGHLRRTAALPPGHPGALSGLPTGGARPAAAPGGFFLFGVVAHRYGWLERFPARTGRIWLAGGLAGAALLFAVGPDADCFAPGGSGWRSALWSLCESALCVALCVGLLTLFRERCAGSGRLRRELAAGSYAVYIIHVPIVVAVQFALGSDGLPALGAWALTAVLALGAAFPAAAGLRRLPGFRSVL